MPPRSRNLRDALDRNAEALDRAREGEEATAEQVAQALAEDRAAREAEGELTRSAISAATEAHRSAIADANKLRSKSLVEQAEQLTARGLLVEAVEIAARAIAEDPGNVRARLVYSDCLHRVGDKSGSLSELQAAAKIGIDASNVELAIATLTQVVLSESERDALLTFFPADEASLIALAQGGYAAHAFKSERSRPARTGIRDILRLIHIGDLARSAEGSREARILMASVPTTRRAHLISEYFFTIPRRDAAVPLSKAVWAVAFSALYVTPRNNRWEPGPVGSRGTVNVPWASKADILNLHQTIRLWLTEAMTPGEIEKARWLATPTSGVVTRNLRSSAALAFAIGGGYWGEALALKADPELHAAAILALLDSL